MQGEAYGFTQRERLMGLHKGLMKLKSQDKFWYSANFIKS